MALVTFVFTLALAPDLEMGILIGMLWCRRKIAPRLITALTIAYVLLYIGCTPVAMYFALGSLEWQFDFDKPIPEDRQAIVVLGGYVTYDPDDPKPLQVGHAGCPPNAECAGHRPPP